MSQMTNLFTNSVFAQFVYSVSAAVLTTDFQNQRFPVLNPYNKHLTFIFDEISDLIITKLRL